MAELLPSLTISPLLTPISLLSSSLSLWSLLQDDWHFWKAHVKSPFSLHHPLCRVSIPLASGTDLSTFKPRTLQEAEGKLSKHYSCANMGPNPKIGFHFGVFWQGWTSFPSCQAPETWGTYCPTDEHKSKWPQIFSDHVSFESTPINDTTCLPKTGLWRPLQANFLASESNAPFPVGHLDALWGKSGKKLNLQLLSYLELLNFHVLCEML